MGRACTENLRSCYYALGWPNSTWSSFHSSYILSQTRRAVASNSTYSPLWTLKSTRELNFPAIFPLWLKFLLFSPQKTHFPSLRCLYFHFSLCALNLLAIFQKKKSCFISSEVNHDDNWPFLSTFTGSSIKLWGEQWFMQQNRLQAYLTEFFINFFLVSVISVFYLCFPISRSFSNFFLNFSQYRSHYFFAQLWQVWVSGNSTQKTLKTFFFVAEFPSFIKKVSALRWIAWWIRSSASVLDW